MSEKISNNSLKLNCEQPHWVKAPSLDTSIKLAGEEAKDRLYEPKHKKKLVRVLTVVAYVFFVSLAAIMLSLYYVFLWKGYPKEIKNTTVTESPLCRDKPDNSDRNLEILTEGYDMNPASSAITSTEDNLSGTNYEDSNLANMENNLYYRKYLYKKLVMS